MRLKRVKVVGKAYKFIGIFGYIISAILLVATMVSSFILIERNTVFGTIYALCMGIVTMYSLKITRFLDIYIRNRDISLVILIVDKDQLDYFIDKDSFILIKKSNEYHFIRKTDIHKFRMFKSYIETVKTIKKIGV